MFSKEGWENWLKESEEGREAPSIVPFGEVKEVTHMSTAVNTVKAKRGNTMSDTNVLEVTVNAFFEAGRTLISYFWKKPFNIENYFKVAGLKNKEEVYPALIKKYVGSKGPINLFSIPVGLNINDFIKHKESIQAQLNKDIDIRYKYNYIEIEIIDYVLPSKINYVLPKRIKDSICIPIGTSLDGVVYLDLKENPHTFVVGTTGSGKSVCTKGILSSLISCYKPSELEIYLGDLKRVELSLFSNVEHCKKFVYTVEDVTELIADLLVETNRRYDLFMEAGVTSIFEYNKLPKIKKLKYQVLYLEEIVMLLEDKSKRAMRLLKQLIAISRSAGLYCFYSTQRPSNDIIDNVVKANTNNRIVFKCEDSKNSIVALDREGAELLEGKGEGLIRRGADITKFRSYFITDNQVKEVTKMYQKKEKYIPLIDTSNLDFNEENKTIKCNDTLVKGQKETPYNGTQTVENMDLSFLD